MNFNTFCVEKRMKEERKIIFQISGDPGNTAPIHTLSFFMFKKDVVMSLHLMRVPWA